MKMLKTKHFRRLAVFLAMIAPAVYLFGSLFSALAGAHGTEVFAEPVYTQEWIDVDSYGSSYGVYRYVVDGGFQTIADKTASYSSSYVVCTTSFYFNETLCGPAYYGYSSRVSNRSLDGKNAFDLYKDDGSYFRLVNYDGTQGVVFPWVFSGQLASLIQIANFIEVGQWQVLIDVPTSDVPENAGAFSDYVFKNFFAKDNFLVEWGENAISENPRGFAPFGAFWRYLDQNVLHLSNDQVGLMGYGYIYYACHVLLFDIGFILVTFFLDFIQKIADKFTGGE